MPPLWCKQGRHNSKKMALPKVTIEIQNGGLGQTTQTNDGIVGLLLQGPAADELEVLTPVLITSLQGAADLGIDADYDTDNTVNVYRQLKEFYDEAGEGAQLYIMLINNAIDIETMLDVAEADYAVKLLDYAQGKIRILGVVRNPAAEYEPVTDTHEIDADVIAALTTGHALAEAYQNEFNPFRIILPGYAYTGDAGGLVDLKTFDKNRCAIIIGGSQADVNAVGLLCGRLASDPVQRNAGRVKSGSLNITEAFIGAEAYIDAQGDVEPIHDKGFISLQQYPRKAGFYFTDDPTATADTDDYNTISRGRVIDKAIILAYDTYINEIKDEVLIDPATGRIQTVQAKAYQALIENAINTAMTANQEISGVTAFVDPAQNVLATGEICVELRIVPVGYAKQIIVKLGFSNPAISN